MTHVTCKLTAKNRDQLRNPTLGNRVWTTFTFVFTRASPDLPAVDILNNIRSGEGAMRPVASSLL